MYTSAQHCILINIKKEIDQLAASKKCINTVFSVCCRKDYTLYSNTAKISMSPGDIRTPWRCSAAPRGAPHHLGTTGIGQRTTLNLEPGAHNGTWV